MWRRSDLSAVDRELVDDGLESVDIDSAAVDLIEVTFSGNVEQTSTPEQGAATSIATARARATPAGCVASTAKFEPTGHGFRIIELAPGVTRE